MNCASSKNAKKSSKKSDKNLPKRDKKEVTELERENNEDEETTEHSDDVQDGLVINLEKIGESTDGKNEYEEVSDSDKTNEEPLEDNGEEEDKEEIKETKGLFRDGSVKSLDENSDDGMIMFNAESEVKENEEDNDDDKQKDLPAVKFAIEDLALRHALESDPFSEFVDRITLLEHLDSCSDERNGHDFHVGEDLLVQYLKKHDKKHLKMTLRTVSWPVRHEVREHLWFRICHHLYKASDEDLFSEFAEDLFPLGKFKVEVFIIYYMTLTDKSIIHGILPKILCFVILL